MRSSKHVLLFLLPVTLLLVLMLNIYTSAAYAESENYQIELADEITVGLNEFIYVPYVKPANAAQPQVSCEISNVCQFGGYAYLTNGACVCFYMTEKGTYPIRFTGDDFQKDIMVHVEDAGTIQLEKELLFVKVGDTVPLGYKVHDGAIYNLIRSNDQEGVSVQRDTDALLITGKQTGYYTLYLSSGQGSFVVIVVDECEGVQLTAPYDRVCVNDRMNLMTMNMDGDEALARIELTDGADCAELIRTNTGLTQLRGIKTGWATVTAYGTDGSTAEMQIQICDTPTQVDVSISATTIAAGESIVVNGDFQPEGSWAPLQCSLESQQPEGDFSQGSVARLQNGVITGVMPGTCILSVVSGGIRRSFDITVTDSADALVIDRPQPYFDTAEGFQLSVHTKGGERIPAEYSVYGSGLEISPEGLLTASSNLARGTVTVETVGGLLYEFSVSAYDFPKALYPAVERMQIAVDLGCDLCEVTADVQISQGDLIACSGDESILRVEAWRILPLRVGTAPVIIWSRYGDASCIVWVDVTEKSGRLYVNGTPDQTLITIPCNTTMELPTVTDYQGNPVEVSWEITSETNPVGRPFPHSIYLHEPATIECVWMDGETTLTATSDTGKKFSLQVSPYGRATDCAFRQSEYTITTGETISVDFGAVFEQGSAFNRLVTSDVSFALTGDMESVQAENFFHYFKFTGMKPGSVTLTATLYNGVSTSTVIHVVNLASCEEGHDPVWRVAEQPYEDADGLRELRCSRCNLLLDAEPIPCTGILCFAQESYYLSVQGTEQSARLGTNMSGNPKSSFTWTSSDPEVVKVEADTVTAVGIGSAVITVTHGDCIPSSCTVHVLASDVLHPPAGLTAIEDEAFEGVAAGVVRIPSHVTSIGSQAFANCTELVHVMIPSSVTYIAEDAFSGCQRIIILCAPDSYAKAYAEAHGIPYYRQ